MATQFEKTLSVTEFKATCLELIEAGAARRLDRVHLTKRGKPFVTLEVKVDDVPKRPTFDEVYGSMKGTTGIPDDFDWGKSLFTDEELAAQEARFLEKFKDWL